MINELYTREQQQLLVILNILYCSQDLTTLPNTTMSVLEAILHCYYQPAFSIPTVPSFSSLSYF